MGVLLKPEQEKELLHINKQLSKRELEDFFTIYPRDNENISSNRGAQNRLGYAVQLCWLRFTGTTFSNAKDIPPYLVKYIASQLDVNPSLFQEYGERRQTRSKHIRSICKDYGFRPYEIAREEIDDFILEELKSGRSSQTLVGDIVNYAKLKRIVLPAIGAIEELVRDSRISFEEKVFDEIHSQLSAKQREALDKLLEVSSTANGGTSILADIKSMPTKNKAKSVVEISRKLQYIKELALNLNLDGIHQNLINKYATSCMNYNAPQLRQLLEKKRLSLLAIFLYHRERILVDAAINICHRIIYEIRKDGNKQFKQANENIEPVKRSFLDFGFRIVSSIKELANDPSVNDIDLRKKLREIVETAACNDFLSSVSSINEMPKDSIALIEKKHLAIRGFALEYLQMIDFKTDIAECKPIIDTIEKMKQHFESPKQKMGNEMPTDFLGDKWKPYVTRKDGTINSNYYDIAFFDTLKTHVLSGNIYVENSHSFKSLNQYLIPKDEFEVIKKSLDSFPAVEDFVSSYKTAIDKSMKLLAEGLVQKAGLSIKDGQLHVSRLNKKRPANSQPFNDEVYSFIPQVKLPDLLFEVAKWTSFDKCFMEESYSRKNTAVIIAALMALGTNLGAERMANSSRDITNSQIASAIARSLTEDNLKKAQAILVNFQSVQRMTQYWGTGRTSSSDGMRVEYGVNSLLADFNPHFGNKKGATFYRFTLDKYISYFVKVIYANSRDARYVIDGLLEHDSNIEIDEHYTDTAGYTDQLFGLCSLLGFSFAPRIRNASESVLFKFEDTDVPEILADISFKNIDEESIRENYDEICRIVYSIKNGYVSSSIILSKLAQKNRHNVIARALQEIGRIEKTLYLQKYFLDEDLRRRVMVGLNKGEAMNGLARVLFFGQDQKLRKREQMGQNQVALALNILINAICIWNTVYVERAIKELRTIKPIDESLFPHLSPLKWKHVIYQGEYRFDPATALKEGEYRELITKSLN